MITTSNAEAIITFRNIRHSTAQSMATIITTITADPGYNICHPLLGKFQWDLPVNIEDIYSSHCSLVYALDLIFGCSWPLTSLLSLLSTLLHSSYCNELGTSAHPACVYLQAIEVLLGTIQEYQFYQAFHTLNFSETV